MFEILPYTPNMESRWDNFVMSESFNGTFLQTRNFLNYHPEGRFEDASFMMVKSGLIVAAFPGNKIAGEFVSHQGSTFGGPIISKNFYNASRTLEIVKTMDEYFRANYKSVKLKITSETFCNAKNDLLEYVLEHEGYERHSELSAVTPLSIDADPFENCDRECRRVFRNADKLNLTYREIRDDELEVFYKFLELSKAKYNTRPVHTLAELRDLKKRLPTEVFFRGVWLGEEYLSGIMTFVFSNTSTIHFQYIAADESKKKLNATAALYIYAMREAAKNGFKKFSWGISTENGGKYLNEALFHYKESFGSEAVLNNYFIKNF